MNPTHTCVGVNRIGNTQSSAKWIAEKILSKVKANRNLPPKEIAEHIFQQYGVEKIPYGRLWHAREVVRHLVFGNIDKNYKLVPRLRAELLMRNEGSHIKYKLTSDNAFEGLFVFFKACVTGFKTDSRPFLGLDGCHLRGKYMGTLLSSTALNGNNGLYHVAFVVVEGESGETWSWFLQNLVIALDSKVQNLSFMSDMEKGLQEDLKAITPLAEHRVCMRYLWKSFKKTYFGAFFERVIWEAARSFFVEEHISALEELRSELEEAFV